MLEVAEAIARSKDEFLVKRLKQQCAITCPSSESDDVAFQGRPRLQRRCSPMVVLDSQEPSDLGPTTGPNSFAVRLGEGVGY
jgi:hypothetical protein